MEALRTKLDNLQWEVNRLDAENRRLRADDEEASQRVDLESELRQTKQDVNRVTEELEACNRRLEDTEQQVLQAELRATVAERRCVQGEDSNAQVTVQLREAEEKLQQADSQVAELQLRIAELERGHGECRDLQEEIDDKDHAIAQLEEEIDQQEEKMESLKTSYAVEKEATQRDAELHHYRRLETERGKWEVREGRLIEQLESMKGSHRPESDSGYLELETAQQNLRQAENELASSQSRVEELEGAKECDRLLIQELRAEVALMKARSERNENPRRVHEPVVEGVAPMLSHLGGSAIPTDTVSLSRGCPPSLFPGGVPGPTSIPPYVSAPGTAVTLVPSTLPTGLPVGLLSSSTGSSASALASASASVSSPAAISTHLLPPLGSTGCHPRPIPVISTTAVTPVPPSHPTTVSSVPTGVTDPAGALAEPPRTSIAMTLRGSGSSPGLGMASAQISSGTITPVAVGTTAATTTATIPTSTTPTSSGAITPTTVVAPDTVGGHLFTTASLLSQLPQLPRFSGEEAQDGEPFLDWHEQFESVAVLGKWDDHCRLVNLTTRLRGCAYSFYRSCTAEQRNNYQLLVAELKKRFTPVRLTAIQSQIFHERQQGPKESVDEYAQELRKLFSKAYAGVARGGPEAERLGQSVLGNQFIAGLRPGLKTRVVGSEGSLDQLLVKARFEEAKKRELDNAKRSAGGTNQNTTPRSGQNTTPRNGQNASPRNGQNTTPRGSQSTTPRNDLNQPTKSGTGVSTPGGRACFNCGLAGHMARSCPYPRQQRGDGEAKGRREPSVATVTPDNSEKNQIAKLRQELHQAEVAAALDEVSATIHGVRPGEEGAQLGPTITTEVCVNGLGTKALIDTGSPATIVSLKFVMKVLARESTDYETSQEWNQAMLPRFEPPSITLKSYSGERLDVIAQIRVCLSQGTCSTDAVVLVQKGAPNELLVGTDNQSLLGLSLLLKNGEEVVDLLDRGSDQDRGEIGEHSDPSSGGTIRLSEELDGRESTVARDARGAENRMHRPVENGILSQSPQGGERQRAQTVLGEAGDPEEKNPIGVVRLLQATRVPAHHKKMIRVKTDCRSQEDVSLFTPSLADPTLAMVEAAVQIDRGGCATLIVENRGHIPVQLKKGMHLGSVEPVEVDSANREEGSVSGLLSPSDGTSTDREEGHVSVLLSPGDGTSAGREGGVSVLLPPADGTSADMEEGGVSVVPSEDVPGDRTKALLGQLEMQLDHLSESEQQELKDLISEYSDVFALNSGELGTTDLVTLETKLQ